MNIPSLMLGVGIGLTIAALLGRASAVWLAGLDMRRNHEETIDLLREANQRRAEIAAALRGEGEEN